MRVSYTVVFTWEKQGEWKDSEHSLFDFADLMVTYIYEPKLQVGDIDLIDIKLLHDAHHYSHIGNNTLSVWKKERKKENAQWEKSQ